MLKLAEVFTDHMLIQRGKPVELQGTADPGQTVQVRLADQSRQTAASGDGTWHVVLDPFSASRALVLEVSAGSETISLNDVAVGDLFLAAGQSNMEYVLQNEAHFKEAQQLVQDMDLRVLYVPQVEYPEQPVSRKLEWKVLDKSNLANDSAVAVYALAEIKKHTDVPLGIVECYKGGTSASCWIGETALQSDPLIRNIFYDKYWNDICDQSEEQEDIKREQYVRIVAKYLDDVAAYQRMYPDRPMSWLKHDLGHTPWPGPKGKKDFGRPGGLHDMMFSRISRLKYKAVWWYQGEEDAKNASAYEPLLSLLIDSWRRELRDDLPFFLVQLPSYIEETYPETWPIIRQAQYEMSSKKTHTHILCTIDLGDSYNIHPTDKLQFGRRLGMLCLETLYGMDLGWQYARLKHFEKAGSGIVLVFEGIEEGGIVVHVDGKERNARIHDGRLHVPAPARTIAYAWQNNVDHVTWNENGLPLFPFRITV